MHTFPEPLRNLLVPLGCRLGASWRPFGTSCLLGNLNELFDIYREHGSGCSKLPLGQIGFLRVTEVDHEEPFVRKKVPEDYQDLSKHHR